MSLPYFPMFPTDFEAKTSHLTLAEDGAYNRLLRLMWMTPGCSLPDDDRWIMRRMRCSKEEFEMVVLVVIEEFCERKDGRVSNAKLTRVFEQSDEAHKKRVAAGSKGGKSKSLKTNNSRPSNAKAKTKQPEPEPEPYKKEDTDVSLPVSPACDASEAVQIFNEAAARTKWPAIQKMNPNRTKQLKARLSEAGGIEGWRSAIQKAEQSDFLCGRTPRPWLGFGFDWLLKAANFTKLMEGNYDQSTGSESAGTPQGRQNRPDPALEQIARLARIG